MFELVSITDTMLGPPPDGCSQARLYVNADKAAENIGACFCVPAGLTWGATPAPPSSPQWHVTTLPRPVWQYTKPDSRVISRSMRQWHVAIPASPLTLPR